MKYSIELKSMDVNPKLKFDYYKFRPPVLGMCRLGTAYPIPTIIYKFGFSKPFMAYPVLGDSLGTNIPHGSFGPAVGQPLVILVRSPGIGMGRDPNGQSGFRFHNVRQFVQQYLVLGSEVRRIEIKIYGTQF